MEAASSRRHQVCPPATPCPPNDSSRGLKRPRESSTNMGTRTAPIEVDNSPAQPQLRRVFKPIKSSPRHGPGLMSPSASASSPSSDGVWGSVTWRLAALGIPFVAAQQLHLNLDALQHNLRLITGAAPAGLTALSPLRVTPDLELAVGSVLCFVADGQLCIRSALENWSFYMEGERRARGSCRTAAVQSPPSHDGAEIEWMRDQYRRMFDRLDGQLCRFLRLDRQRARCVDLLIAAVGCCRATAVLRQPELWWDMSF